MGGDAIDSLTCQRLLTVAEYVLALDTLGSLNSRESHLVL